MSLIPAGDIVESAALIGLNSAPVTVLTRGEGSAGFLLVNEDTVAVTANNVQFSTYTLGPRIPTNGKIKRVALYGTGVDTAWAPTFAIDVNLIFSDAPLGGVAAAANAVNDGTAQANAGRIATLSGGTTSISDYASPNKLFGSSIVPVGSSGAPALQDVTYSNGFTFAERLLPLWDILGFPQDPGGFFDFFLVCETASTAAAPGTLGIITEFVV